MSWVSDWWNGLELWITQLSFPVQFAVVIAVLLPLCTVAGWLLDRGVDVLASRLSPKRNPEPPMVQQDAEARQRSAVEDHVSK